MRRIIERLMSAAAVAASTALAIVGVLPAGPALAGPHPGVERRVMGGTPAPGDPRVVSLAVLGAGGWGQCSGALWRPRLIITAAHCVTLNGSADLVAQVAVFAPGAPAQIYRDVGPQGAAPVQVVSVLRPASYVNASDRVAPNDVAVIVLDRDLAPAGFHRLAAWPEVEQWQTEGVVITHVGYGLTGPGQRTILPNAASLPLVSTSNGASGVRFGTAQTAETATCPGDSGSPAYRATPAGDVLVGVVAGSSAPCTVGSSGTPGVMSPTPGPSNVGFVALGYPDVLDSALAAAGYPLIPGPPAAVGAGWLPGSPGSVVVAWQPTARNLESATGVEVWEGDTLVCPSGTGTSCVITGAAAGTHAYRARSVNAQGEGDVTVARATVDVPQAAGAALSALSAPSAPLQGRAQPWIVGQPIVAFAGCLVRKPAASRLEIKSGRGWRELARGSVRRDALLCPSARRPLALTYSFTLAATDLARVGPSGVGPSGVGSSGVGRVIARSVVDRRAREVRREAFTTIDAWAATLTRPAAARPRLLDPEPGKVAVVGMTGQAALNWNAEPGAAFYDVSSEGKTVCLTVYSSCTVPAPNGVRRSYKVTAVSPNGRETPAATGSGAAKSKGTALASVYFAPGSSTLDAADLRILRRTLNDMGALGLREVFIVGHTDSVGSFAANRALSADRIEAVHNWMNARRLDAIFNDQSKKGEAQLKFPETPGNPDPRNRRVDIFVR